MDKKVLIPIVRNVWPEILAKDLVDVQPMIANNGSIFRFKPMFKGKCEFCGSSDCNLYERIISLHDEAFDPFPNSQRIEYYLIARKSKNMVEAFFHDILITTYAYEDNNIIDYFIEEPIQQRQRRPMVFKQQLLALRHDLHHQDQPPHITEDSLADHGIYFYG